MGELGALFNPGMRHELEERRSKAMRREEEGNARDGDLRIDLESGVAVINVPGGDGGAAQPSPVAAEHGGVAEHDAVTEQDAVTERGAAADQDRPRVNDRPDQAAADTSTTTEENADAAAAPAPPRPRGKRGLAASSR